MTSPRSGRSAVSDRRLTPQQKKALSYERDRRNVYDENDKSSRKNIPLRKRLVSKANRHADRRPSGTRWDDPAPTSPNTPSSGWRGDGGRSGRSVPTRPWGSSSNDSGSAAPGVRAEFVARPGQE